jgi:DNA-binding FadR family transcriptional regulator
VSRPTAREAVLARELIGAVEVRHGEGVFVLATRSQLDGVVGSAIDEPPRELIESRCVIEPPLAGLAAERMQPRHVAPLRRLVDESEELINNVALLPRFVSAGLRFHAEPAPGCGNRLLAGVVARLVDVAEHPLWALVNQQAMRTREARAGQVAEHRVVLQAITARDAAGAERGMREHLLNLTRVIFLPGTSASVESSRQNRGRAGAGARGDP